MDSTGVHEGPGMSLEAMSMGAGGGMSRVNRRGGSNGMAGSVVDGCGVENDLYLGAPQS